MAKSNGEERLRDQDQDIYLNMYATAMMVFRYQITLIDDIIIILLSDRCQALPKLGQCSIGPKHHSVGKLYCNLLQV